MICYHFRICNTSKAFDYYRLIFQSFSLYYLAFIIEMDRIYVRFLSTGFKSKIFVRRTIYPYVSYIRVFLIILYYIVTRIGTRLIRSFFYNFVLSSWFSIISTVEKNLTIIFQLRVNVLMFTLCSV